MSGKKDVGTPQHSPSKTGVNALEDAALPTLQETVGSAAAPVDHTANIRGVIDHLLTAAAAYAGGNVGQCRRALTKADVALAATRAGFDKRHVERLSEGGER